MKIEEVVDEVESDGRSCYSEDSDCGRQIVRVDAKRVLVGVGARIDVADADVTMFADVDVHHFSLRSDVLNTLMFTIFLSDSMFSM
ncbi:hypothetical protein LOK49_LG09G01666 [Camellia lanceoleosa]|uniref:Uncharacterized protein n=1 Tax=Camellia lanceoleosa TaxID=1840588 RepID=A0ACC0GDV2_9ERIC|nr:hypothetical protein LOK49_LG09G01666 [Camellia lanceoleosa]